MKAPNQEQREALERLNFSKDGKDLLRFLEEALAEANTRMTMDDDVDRVRIFQGEARTLRGLIALLKPVSI
jgi:hypothetical protein